MWQKSSDDSCYKKFDNPGAYPSKCDDGTEPDSAWYTPLRPCVVPNEKANKVASLKSLPKWPQRLHTPPGRISNVYRGTGSSFKRDDSKWKTRVKHYKKLLPALGTDEIRNVMDMNTAYGGFAAAVIDDPLWVMNVVSSYSANSLPVVYDRGLIGTHHDWYATNTFLSLGSLLYRIHAYAFDCFICRCEAFSTYPRTYDLLHLDGLFTAESHR